eukprot:scpid79972/ scgid12051/ RWD domain-containing protein 3; RWD domain-containing sumoylation enhancer
MENIVSQVDEVEALQAILCGDGEMRVRTPQRLATMQSIAAHDGCSERNTHAQYDDVSDDPDPLILEVNICLEDRVAMERGTGTGSSIASPIRVQLVVTLPAGYPGESPLVSVSSSSSRLSRESCARLRSTCRALCSQLIGQCVVMEMVQHVRDSASDIIGEEACCARSSVSDSRPAANASNEQAIYHGLLHVDHMHARNSYCKTLRSWCRELGITGSVIFMGRLILVVVESDSIDSLNTYIRWHRTRPVDVDTSGRTCKEHCLKMLQPPTCYCRADGDGVRRRFDSFTVVEVQSRKELEKIFIDRQLEELAALIPFGS